MNVFPGTVIEEILRSAGGGGKVPTLSVSPLVAPPVMAAAVKPAGAGVAGAGGRVVRVV